MLALAVLLIPASARGSAAVERGPFLLVSLPALGTVTWRCEQGRERYALAFRAFRASATVQLRLTTGRIVRRATVDPGESVRFPSAGRSQRLGLVQQTGAGTLRASVTVGFEEPTVAPYCYAYLPPRVSVELGPGR